MLLCTDKVTNGKIIQGVTILAILSAGSNAAASLTFLLSNTIDIFSTSSNDTATNYRSFRTGSRNYLNELRFTFPTALAKEFEEEIHARG